MVNKLFILVKRLTVKIKLMKKTLTPCLAFLLLCLLFSCNSCKKENGFVNPKESLASDRVDVVSYNVRQRPDNPGIPVYLTLYLSNNQKPVELELSSSEAAVTLGILKLGHIVYDTKLKYLYSETIKLESLK